jgi:hypothetical protein
VKRYFGGTEKPFPPQAWDFAGPAAPQDPSAIGSVGLF